jgi:serine/threonine protein kinase
MSPPDIPGYRYERLLGSGGYSDVFLYEQDMPRRPVAIKVLLADRLDDRALQQVSDEANAMAAVSTHPYIVTIFHADVGRTGNPFMVMEYYPRPNYSVRARTEQLSVAEVLRAGIQVASAVETAHRAGIIHRDIKPANILTSEYGRPGLTDFGIAGLADGSAAGAEGLSVPWSPPEVITGDGNGDVASDVYSLGATIYSLLAGRSPFEVRGGANSTLDLLERIQRGDPPPTGRGDVPATLERLLRHAMARRPADRPSSAADLARALQDVEVQQQFAMTPLEVRDDGSSSGRARPIGGAADDDGTRLKNPTVIQAQGPAAPIAPAGERGGGSDGLVSGVPALGPEGATVLRSSLDTGPSTHTPPPFPFGEVAIPPSGPAAVDTGSPASWPGPLDEPLAHSRPNRFSLARVAWIGLLLVALLFLARIAVGGSDTDSTTTTTADAVSGEAGAATVRPPTGVEVSNIESGAVEVTWTPAAGAAPDSYLVLPQGTSVVDPSAQDVDGEVTTATLPAGTTCVDVRAVRRGVRSAPATGCLAEGP